MESYIVRIYRRAEQDNAPVSGLVEKPGVVGQEAFGTKEELWNILSVMKATKRRNRNTRSQGAASEKKQESTD